MSNYKILINSNGEPRLVEVPQEVNPNDPFLTEMEHDRAIDDYEQALSKALTDESKHIPFKDIEQAKRIINPCDCLKGKSLCFMPCGHSYDGWPSKHIGQTFDLPIGYSVSFEHKCFTCEAFAGEPCKNQEFQGCDAEPYMKVAILTPESVPSPKQGDGWISVKDRLPEESENVLICTKHGKISKGCLWNDIQFSHKQDYHWSYYDVDGRNRLEESDVTHWRPLPPLPKAPTKD